MKKIFALLLAARALCALPLGNPYSPALVYEGLWIPESSAFGLKIGYEGDFVFDRDIQHATFKSLANQGVLTLNFLDRLELYGSAGAFSAHFRHEGRHYETASQWCAGGGFTFLISEWGPFALGIDAKGLWANPRIHKISGDASKASLLYREWQVGLGASYTWEWLSPYVGAKYSSAEARVQDVSQALSPHSHFKMGSRERFGMALGCSFSSGSDFDLGLEGQFFDETALSVAMNLRF